MRKYIWICDRCGMEIKPRVLEKDEMYITRKKGNDVDLCEYCLKSLSVWFNQRPIPKFVEDKTYTEKEEKNDQI